MNKTLTKDEQKIWDMIIEIQILYSDLEIQHPSDGKDWADSIHSLQKLMCLRITRREHPKLFV